MRYDAFQFIIEEVGLKLQIAPACLPKLTTEANGINDEQNDERRRYGEQCAHPDY